jgi:hypothetical protein
MCGAPRRFKHVVPVLASAGSGPSGVANEAGRGPQVARAGHPESPGESTPMSLGSWTHACFVSPNTL